MAVLNPTPPHLLVDADGRPYFLWNSDTTLDELRDRVRTGDAALRGYLIGKLLRQAKPDDVFEFVTLAEVRAVWPHVEPHLGRTRDFWSWILSMWDESPSA